MANPNWVKGVSGNPSGRPLARPFLNALRMSLTDPEPGRVDDGMPKLREIAAVLVGKAMQGDTRAIQEIADRLDGKPVQQTIISGDEDAPMRNELTVNFVHTKHAPVDGAAPVVDVSVAGAK